MQAVRPVSFNDSSPAPTSPKIVRSLSLSSSLSLCVRVLCCPESIKIKLQKFRQEQNFEEKDRKDGKAMRRHGWQRPLHPLQVKSFPFPSITDRQTDKCQRSGLFFFMSALPAVHVSAPRRLVYYR